MPRNLLPIIKFIKSFKIFLCLKNQEEILKLNGKRDGLREKTLVTGYQLTGLQVNDTKRSYNL